VDDSKFEFKKLSVKEIEPGGIGGSGASSSSSSSFTAYPVKALSQND